MKCKSTLRRDVLARRNQLPPDEIRRLSEAASSRFFGLPEVTAAQVVMFFVSFGSELDTLPMIRRALAEGKGVAAPQTDPATRKLTPRDIRDLDKDLARGAHSIREPRPRCPEVDLSAIDVVVVPAAVWGQDGYRVGYGGGYYDRFLARLKGAVRIGLGLEMQVVAEVPHGPRDLPVDILVTDARVRRFAGATTAEGK
jgi:5-formyltetrahydrofolate cyclo-ligase